VEVGGVGQRAGSGTGSPERYAWTRRRRKHTLNDAGFLGRARAGGLPTMEGTAVTAKENAPFFAPFFVLFSCTLLACIPLHSCACQCERVRACVRTWFALFTSAASRAASRFTALASPHSAAANRSPPHTIRCEERGASSGPAWPAVRSVTRYPAPPPARSLPHRMRALPAPPSPRP
jgi:hypothetical protein